MNPAQVKDSGDSDSHNKDSLDLDAAKRNLLGKLDHHAEYLSVFAKLVNRWGFRTTDHVVADIRPKPFCFPEYLLRFQIRAVALFHFRHVSPA